MAVLEAGRKHTAMTEGPDSGSFPSAGTRLHQDKQEAVHPGDSQRTCSFLTGRRDILTLIHDTVPAGNLSRPTRGRARM